MLDIFNNDAFRHTVLTDALENTEFVPSRLSTLGIFVKKGVRSESVAFEMRDNGSIGLVPTSPRGAPLPQATKGKRRMRSFNTTRVGLSDRIHASEIQFVRQFGEEEAVQQMQSEIAQRWDGPDGLRPRINLTLENMALGAVQGKFVDHDGSIIEDWVTAFDKSGAPATTIPTVTFDFATLKDGKLKEKLVKLKRDISRSSDGVWTPATKFHVLVGDEFFDQLALNEEVRQAYSRRNENPYAVDGNDAYSTIEYAGWTFENYRGTDDKSTVAIKDNEGHAFPTNTNGAFQIIQSPAESFDDIGTVGRDMYTYIDQDPSGRNRFADLEMTTYPLYACTRPKMLRKFVLA